MSFLHDEKPEPPWYSKNSQISGNSCYHGLSSQPPLPDSVPKVGLPPSLVRDIRISPQREYHPHRHSSGGTQSLRETFCGFCVPMDDIPVGVHDVNLNRPTKITFYKSKSRDGTGVIIWGVLNIVSLIDSSLQKRVLFCFPEPLVNVVNG